MAAPQAFHLILSNQIIINNHNNYLRNLFNLCIFFDEGPNSKELFYYLYSKIRFFFKLILNENIYL